MSTEIKKEDLEKVVTKWIAAKGCKILNISQPEDIAEIAKNQKIDALDVFVRITFEFNGKQYKASQRLDVLGKEDYQMLLDKQKSGETVDFKVSNTEFFKIYREVKFEDLFKNAESRKAKDLRNSVTELFA